MLADDHIRSTIEDPFDRTHVGALPTLISLTYSIISNNVPLNIIKSTELTELTSRPYKFTKMN